MIEIIVVMLATVFLLMPIIGGTADPFNLRSYKENLLFGCAVAFMLAVTGFVFLVIIISVNHVVFDAPSLLDAYHKIVD